MFDAFDDCDDAASEDSGSDLDHAFDHYAAAFQHHYAAVDLYVRGAWRLVAACRSAWFG